MLIDNNVIDNKLSNNQFKKMVNIVVDENKKTKEGKYNYAFESLSQNDKDDNNIKLSQLRKNIKEKYKVDQNNNHIKIKEY